VRLARIDYSPPGKAVERLKEGLEALVECCLPFEIDIVQRSLVTPGSRAWIAPEMVLAQG
jgi:hypothetical protein